MPSHDVHKKITKALTGKEYAWVHKMLDVGVKQLGPHHRKHTHTQEMCGLILLMSGGDLGALVAAESHILADREFTRSKRFLTKLLGGKKNYKRKRR